MKKLITIIFVIMSFGGFAQRAVSGDTLKIRGGGSFGNTVVMDTNQIKQLDTATNSHDAVPFFQMMDSIGDIGNPITEIDATNISSVKFTRSDGTFLYEPFDHMHNEYQLVSESALGTVTSVSSSTTNQLTIINGSSTPTLTIVTGAIANASTDLVISDLIFDSIAALRGDIDNLLYLKVFLSTAEVAALGTKFELIPAPGVGSFLQVVAVSYFIDVGVQLDVGAQGLTIGYYSGSNPVCSINEAQLESANDLYLQLLAEKVNAEFEPNDSFGCVLTAATNPSGSATMTFYITYKIITL